LIQHPTLAWWQCQLWLRFPSCGYGVIAKTRFASAITKMDNSAVRYQEQLCMTVAFMNDSPV